MRIALTLDRDADLSESNDYLRSLVEAGVPREAIEVVTPLSPVSRPFDALVLGGGGDVDPARYGQPPLENGTLEVDPERDRIDFALFDEARRTGAPVLGICRGLQVVNVALGGTLVQDIPAERPSEVVHARTREEKTRLDHTVAVAPETRLSALAAAPQVRVNSRHHQAIDALAPGLAITGLSPDGLPEAVEATGDTWVLAVQWHPENLAGDPVSRRLFSEFVRAARERAARAGEADVPAESARR
jgi:putative glutamine amidotransferase